MTGDKRNHEHVAMRSGVASHKGKWTGLLVHLYKGELEQQQSVTWMEGVGFPMLSVGQFRGMHSVHCTGQHLQYNRCTFSLEPKR